MHVETFNLPHAWYRRTSAYLLRHEAANNLLFGIAYTLMNDPGAFSEYYLATVVDDETIVGAAVMTVPYNLVLSHVEHRDALDALAGNLARSYRVLPGVNGSPPAVYQFAQLWTERTDIRHEVDMKQRIYQLREVTPPQGVAGELRIALQKDTDLLAEWHYAFAQDANMPTNRDHSRMWAERIFTTNIRRIFLWMVDDVPVSMVGTAGPTPNGIRIGPVFTPREHRGNGYASAATAAVSQRMLDEGKTVCFLYTDLANPTSNKIYQNIGYTPVIDSDVVRFLNAPRST